MESVPLNNSNLFLYESQPFMKASPEPKGNYFNEQTRALISSIDFFPGNLELFEAKLNFCAHHSEAIHSESTTMRAIANRLIESPDTEVY